MSARRREEHFINRANRDAFVQPAFFLAGNRSTNGVANVIAFKNLFTLFSSILNIRICDRSAQFLVNCFEKIV